MLAKRQLVIRAFAAPAGSVLFACAPTWDQVYRVFWDDLVALTEQMSVLGGQARGAWIKRKTKAAGNAHIELVNGTKILLVSGVAADRAEGIDEGLWWGVIDEYGNMPAGVWGENIRPQLAQNRGGAWLIGVPHGGGSHYQDVADRARAQRLARHHLAANDGSGARQILAEFYGDSPALEELVAQGADALEWDCYCWPSDEILDPAEVAKMAEDLDSSLFEQEARGAFVSFLGRVYKPFTLETHGAPLFAKYNPRAPLHLSLDFNVAPGASVIGQDMELPWGERGTAYIGEVAISRDATTELICRAFLDEWEGHAGTLYVRGDATGGQRSTAAAESGGTDWKIVKGMLRGKFGQIVYDVPGANPAEIDRVNATNARLMSTDGKIRVGVDPARCPHLVRDLQRVTWMDGVRKIDKKDPEKTHWTDAMGYDLVTRFPIPDYSASGARSLTGLVA